MSLSDVTADGVKLAMAEFDRLGRKAFLNKYGFRQARGYFLIEDGHRYDSKAVVGVAHGYDLPGLGPLRPQDFSDSDARVARHLESLGFDVERPPRNPTWAVEELVLALDLYLRSGLLDKADRDVIDLSRLLNDLTVHSERPDAVRFRNPSGVALKLANFAAIDPNHAGRGMTRGGKRDAEVWKQYASDEDALAVAAAALRDGHGLPAVPFGEPTGTHIEKVEVEAQHVEQFTVSVPGQDIEATRREQTLVLAYSAHLKSQDHIVERHRYKPEGSVHTLVCDLVDVTDRVLYEAKGDVRRTSVRMAIGQLLDYHRFYCCSEQPPLKLAILLPRKPPEDLIRLLHKVPASVVWRTREGFECIKPSDASNERARW